MDRVTTTLIDLAEAAYDFESRDSEWLPTILASGRPLLDHGLGVAAGIFARSRDGRETVLRELHLIAVPERCARRLARVAADIPHSGARSGVCMTLSEAVGETHALALAGWASHGGCAKDALNLWATDASGAGVFIMAPIVWQRDVPVAQRREGHHREIKRGFELLDRAHPEVHVGPHDRVENRHEKQAHDGRHQNQKAAQENLGPHTRYPSLVGGLGVVRQSFGVALSPPQGADRSLRHVDVLPPRRVETLLAHPRHRGGIAREQGRAIYRAGRAPVGREAG